MTDFHVSSRPRRRVTTLLAALSLVVGSALSPQFAAGQNGGSDPVRTTDLSPEMIAALQWRPIGPAVMGGRIADIAAVDGDTFFVGAATGNLWKTTNRGTTWTTLFDERDDVNSIGDVTVAPSNPNIVWIGTGEANNRQSSPWGAGVYHSDDGGESWEHKGLTESRHIGRIAIHPNDPDTLYVAAVGNLWAAGEERGIYRSTDGGDSWERVLYIDENTGAIDLIMHPSDPKTLIAGMYQRRRSACCFVGGGPGSGLYRTTDGGDTWEELTEGLPEGDKGRWGLDYHRADGNIVYATVEASGEGTGIYRSMDGGSSWEKRSDTNPRPMYFSQVRVDPVNPQRVYVLGVRLAVSDDGGVTFNENAAARVHSDHHAMWIDPEHPDHIIMGSDGGVHVSFDASGSWRMLDNLDLGQFYEIGVDNREPYWVYGGLQDNGSWGGPSNTLDGRGIRNADWFNVNGGDGFYARVDPQDPSILFAESQNGNLVRVDLDAMERQSIRPVARPDRAMVAEWPGGGDDQETAVEGEEAAEPDPYRWNWNSPIVISSHDRATIYYGGNALLRSRDRGLTWEQMSPDLTRAINRDEEELMGVKPVLGILSRNDGISSYGNITTLSESPLDADVVYVGTDDGNVQRTVDGGANWTDITETFPGLPDRTYVSRLTASSAVAGRVYATFDNHYHGDFRPFVYVSDDHGDTWTTITGGLPGWSVNVIAEHPRTPDLLFLGNELGVWFSIDRGTTWARLDNNLPTVPVDDIVIHESSNDLVIGTHGRSIWILEDITPLEHFASAASATAPMLFPVRPATAYNVNSPQGWSGNSEFRAPNPANGAIVRYWIPEGWQPAPPEAPEAAAGSDVPAATGSAQRGRRRGERGVGERAQADEGPTLEIQIVDGAGNSVRTLKGSAKPGIQQLVWDLRTDPPFEAPPGQPRGRFNRPPPGLKVPAGTYRANIEGVDTGAVVAVAMDPRMNVAPEDAAARQSALQAAFAYAKPYTDANAAVTRLRQRLEQIDGEIKAVANAPEDLTTSVEAIGAVLDEVGDSLRGDRRVLFAAFGIERSSARPTDDQIYTLEQARQRLPALIAQLNDVIGEQIPQLYVRMNEAGIRPDPGPLLALPGWKQ